MPDMPEEGERFVIHLEVTAATLLSPGNEIGTCKATLSAQSDQPGSHGPSFHDHSHDAHNVWPHN